MAEHTPVPQIRSERRCRRPPFNWRCWWRGRRVSYVSEVLMAGFSGGLLLHSLGGFCNWRAIVTKSSCTSSSVRSKSPRRYRPTTLSIFSSPSVPPMSCVAMNDLSIRSTMSVPLNRGYRARSALMQSSNLVSRRYATCFFPALLLGITIDIRRITLYTRGIWKWQTPHRSHSASEMTCCRI